MRTRSSSNLIVESSTIPKRRNRRRSKQIVEPEIRTIVETPVVTMADTRTMSELLQAPTEGYGDAIVIPAILAENFELKVGLLQLVTSSQFHGFERDDPHAHIRWFNKITSTLKYKNVPHDAIKLMLFPFSLEGAARIWLEKEPPRSILTWEDLVSKFVNYFFPPSKTTNLKNDITNFQQKFEETFSEAWDRFKELLRKCPHHGFSELHQIDTFYNALTQSDQDSLNAAAGVLMNKANQQASVKAVDEICMTCGGPHPYYECLAIDNNTFNAYATTWTYNKGGPGYHPQGDPNYRASNQMGPHGFPPNVQNNQNYNWYNQNQGNYQAPNNQGRGQNFNQGNNNYQAPNFQALVGHSNELTNYLKSNEATLRAMQTQMTNMKTELQNEFKSSLDTRTNKIENQNNQIMNMLTNLTMQKRNSSGSGSLPTNTVANPRGDVKAIITRSGVAYDGPTIPPTPSPLPKEVERETEMTKDKLEVAPKPNPKPSIPYPSRLNDQKPREKANNQMLKFLQIFQRLHFDISFADALLHMPKFASTFKKAFAPGTYSDSHDTRSRRLIVDYDVDPRVPLILGRPLLRTSRALIDVHGEELTLLVNDEAITFKVEHTSRYSRNYYDETVHQINVIDGGDFVLEEIEACLSNDSIPPGIDDADFDPEGDIRLLEKLLNDDPSSPLPQKELNFEELKMINLLLMILRSLSSRIYRLILNMHF
ncbi:reverse transcriptase domain-containing protein [Tanacetum coccineum]